KQRPAYDVGQGLEFRRVLFRSWSGLPVGAVCRRRGVGRRSRWGRSACAWPWSAPAPPPPPTRRRSPVPSAGGSPTPPPPADRLQDRKGVGEGKRVELGGVRIVS